MSAHHHGHSHAHVHVHATGPRAYLVPLTVTFGYAGVELVGGLWSGSLALTSDAGHMFSDALALGLAAGAAWLAQRPPGLRHSYGLGRAEVLGAALNGLLMLGIIVVLVVHAVERLLEPRPVVSEAVMAIAVLGLFVNGAVAFYLSRGSRDLNLRGALVHVMGDLVSSLAALIAGAVIYATGWLLIDPILSLVIAALILVTTLTLLRDTLHVLMEGVPNAVELDEIGHALAGIAGVTAAHDLHVWSIGSLRQALTAHLDVDRIEQWPMILNAAKTLLHERFGIDHITLQPELTGGLPRQAPLVMWPRGERPS